MNARLHKTALHFVLVVFSTCTLLCAQNRENNQQKEFRVKLLSQVSTETNQKGDAVTAQVISPQEYAGYFMEGQVRNLKKGKGKSSLALSFDTLEMADHSGKIAIRSWILSVVNSKGAANVDEEGTVIKKTNNLGRTAIATGAGALIGGLLGGGQGAAIGAGVGAASAIVFMEMHGEKANRITFAPGTEFVVSVLRR